MTMILVGSTLAVALPNAVDAAPLVSSVSKMDFEPSVVIVPEAVGKTPEARYRVAAPNVLPAHVPIAVEVRLSQANQPDTVTVLGAERSGKTITITIERRMSMCELSKNISWVPLVEIRLGELDPGDYQLNIDETVRHFGEAEHCDPALAKPVGHGLGSRGPFTVR
jgi:hypothetical protein